jgi:ABC-type transport system substrate-binding protein
MPSSNTNGSIPVRDASRSRQMRARHDCQPFTLPSKNGEFANSAVDARTKSSMADRVKAYEQVAAQAMKDRPIVYLYHRNWLWAYNSKLTGVREVPDGLLRLEGLKLN